MKLGREFHSEEQAHHYETALQASGYRAWRNRKADGEWTVFWWVPPSETAGVTE